jgi:hypothetical protein
MLFNALTISVIGGLIVLKKYFRLSFYGRPAILSPNLTRKA